MSNGRRQITVAGMMAYTSLWALVICLFHQAAKLQAGIHTIYEDRLSQILMLIATGILFVAIGIPITFAVGRTRQAAPILLGCFFVGFIAIPSSIIILVALHWFGVINLDL